MKPQEKILTYEQARELKWFCKNVAGTRQEFYEALGVVEKFKEKIDRLQTTADMILKWCEENNIKMVGEPHTLGPDYGADDENPHKDKAP